MLVDVILAVLALATLALFIGVVVWKIAALPLTIIAVLVIGLAAYDFWLTAGRNGDGAEK